MPTVITGSSVTTSTVDATTLDVAGVPIATYVYTYGSRVSPSTSANQNVFTYTTSFTPVSTANKFVYWSVIPCNTNPISQDYSGFGLRFSNGTSHLDTRGQGTMYVENDSDALTMGMQNQTNFIAANQLPSGTLSIYHRLYATASNAVCCPNSSDNNRLNQTEAKLIIMEYA
jgi:hypothetical protein